VISFVELGIPFDPFDRFVFSDVWSKFESVCNGFVSASSSGSAEMLSAAI
jgi:hypothetical protein